MRELTFVGLSGDGAALLVSDDRGTTYAVPLDERLSTAVRRDRTRLGQLEITLEPLRPKDIQARIRAGATTEEVADAAGWEVAKVERFASPVLAERAWIAEQAQAVEIRRPEGDITLRDLVDERLGGRGVDVDHVRWDAWRRDDGRWTVLLAYPAAGGDQVATWVFDTTGRTVLADDEEARWIVEEPEPEPAPEPDARPYLVAVPAPEEPPRNPRHDTIPVVRQTDVFEAVAAAEATATVDGPNAPVRGGGPLPGDEDAYSFEPEDEVSVAIDEPATGVAAGPDVAPAATEVGVADLLGAAPVEPAPAKPARGRGTKGRRSSVPSWDEILFGAARSDGDES